MNYLGRIFAGNNLQNFPSGLVSEVLFWKTAGNIFCFSGKMQKHMKQQTKYEEKTVRMPLGACESIHPHTDTVFAGVGLSTQAHTCMCVRVCLCVCVTHTHTPTPTHILLKNICDTPRHTVCPENHVLYDMVLWHPRQCQATVACEEPHHQVMELLGATIANCSKHCGGIVPRCFFVLPP